jgi:hypothetical protein
MNCELHERGLKAGWHAAIAVVGAYEYRHSKSLFARILAIGLIAFHLDAAFCDAIDQPTVLQRVLKYSLHPRLLKTLPIDIPKKGLTEC